ncbi:MAG TPA: DUF4159 domain-containing protein [Tepidisphaeraceae bacterium]|nr:DUF4159 domain-containing protein [Tepidisphaeraceae bacterium]
MPLSAGASAATSEQVQKAIDKGQAFLLANRNAQGNWEEIDEPQVGKEVELRTSTQGRQWGGLTALSTYALLASGKDARDPELAEPIKFLLHANIESTYALGLSSQLALYLPHERTRDLIPHNLGKLSHGIFMTNAGYPPARWPAHTGFYSYWTGEAKGSLRKTIDLKETDFGRPQNQDWFDLSNSQYGVLGMWALEQAGASPPEGYWKVVDAAWRRAQSEYGGWNYHPSENGATCSMTAAGVATLFITQDYALQHNWGQCQGGVKDPAIDRGLAWMDHNIDEAVSSSCYTIFGIERIGAASGRTTFGSRDWFQVGADYLINHQKEDGSWKTDHGEVPDTSFALLFLSRGRAPVLMNKLEYDATDPGDKPVVDAWNQRPRDVANLASWAGRQEESYFNWQIVDLKTSLERLHDSPVLMICGSRPLEFTTDQKMALRTFVEDGGMIVGNADCGQAGFSDSFIKLGRELFPKYQFGAVPPNDLLWSEQYTQWRTKPEVWQMTNGVRKLMMLIPTADAARAWQAHLEGPREPLFELGVSMFLYAADRKHLQTKDAPYVVQADTTIKGKRRLKLVRLMAGDNPDPEPGGWRRLSAILHNQRQIDLTLLSAAPGEGLLAAVKIAHLTGTTTISLSEPARTEIRAFVQNGGTLIVDSAGGGAAFADAAQAELEHIFGAGKIVLLPPDSPVYHQKGITFGTVPWRRFAQAHVANQKAPQLHGIMTGSRIGVFFSREDLSAGLVGQPVDGVNGYEPSTATNLMQSMLLYAITPA